MRAINIIFGSFITLLSMGLGAQDFHASTTKIEYESRTQELTITAKFFTADLEKAAGTSTSNKSQFNASMKPYVNNNFTVKVNGQNVNVVYKDIQTADKSTRIYLKVDNVGEISSIEVKNSMLVDLFPDQQNLVTFDVNGIRKSFTTKKGKDSGVATF